MATKRSKKVLPLIGFILGIACIMFGLGVLAITGTLSSLAIMVVFVVVGMIITISSWGELSRETKDFMTTPYVLGLLVAIIAALLVAGHSLYTSLSS